MYSNITKKTFNLIFEKKYALVKALLIPFILIVIVEYFLNPLLKEQIFNFNFYVLMGVSFLITIIMSILVHRILLLDESQTPTWGIYKLGKRELNFFIKILLTGIIIGLISVGIGLIIFIIAMILEAIIGDIFSEKISIILPIFIMIFTAIIFSRLSLVFPATAIDKPLSFTTAYSITKEYKLLTFMMIVVVPFLFGAIVGFAYGIVIEFLMGIISQKLSLLYSFLNIFITIFTIGFLSVTYEYILSNQPEKIES